MSNQKKPDDRIQQEAQASLDQIRHQSGGMLTGQEIRKRWGRQNSPDDDLPPLDWRMTPRNVLMQLLVLGLFGGVIWFLITLLWSSWEALFS